MPETIKDIANFALDNFLSETEKQELEKIKANAVQKEATQPKKEQVLQKTEETKAVASAKKEVEELKKEKGEIKNDITDFEIPDDIEDEEEEEGKIAEETKEEPAIEEEPAESEEQFEDEKQGKAFASMRNEIKKLKQELIESKSKLEREKEEYKKTIEELTNKLSKYSLQENPRFKQEFEQPLVDIEKQITRLLKEFEVENPEATASSLLNASMKKRAEFLRENLPEIGHTILNLTMQYDNLMEKRNAALAQHNELRKKYEEEEANRRQIENIRLRQEMFSKSLSELVEEGQFILTPSEKNETWNKILEATKQRMKYLFETDDLKEQAKALILGAAAPVYLKMFQIERAKRKELEKKLNDIVKTNKTGKQSQVSPKKEELRNLSAMDIITEVLNKKS